MKQLTLRVPDDLVAELKAAAAAEGKSVNALAETALMALVDPEAEGEEIERIRARLRRAGLLFETPPFSGQVPDPDEVAEAGRAAAHGTLLSDLVSEDRGPR